jgi:hypothetical protein
MKIEIENAEDEFAACIWADATWSGKHEKPATEIACRVLLDAASRYRMAFPNASASALESFRKRKVK